MVSPDSWQLLDQLSRFAHLAGKPDDSSRPGHDWRTNEAFSGGIETLPQSTRPDRSAAPFDLTIC